MTHNTFIHKRAFKFYIVIPCFLSLEIVVKNILDDVGLDYITDQSISWTDTSRFLSPRVCLE